MQSFPLYNGLKTAVSEKVQYIQIYRKALQKTEKMTVTTLQYSPVSQSNEKSKGNKTQKKRNKEIKTNKQKLPPSSLTTTMKIKRKKAI